MPRLLYMLEPLFWSALTGAMTGLADYLHSVITREAIDYTRMSDIAVAGAILGLAAYLRDPKKGAKV